MNKVSRIAIPFFRATLLALVFCAPIHSCSNNQPDTEPEIEEISENRFADHTIVSEWDWVMSYDDRTDSYFTSDSIDFSWQQVYSANGDHHVYFGDTLNFSTTYHLEYVPYDPRYPTGDSILVIKYASSQSFQMFEIRSDTLIFDLRYLDGPIDYFVKKASDSRND